MIDEATRSLLDDLTTRYNSTAQEVQELHRQVQTLQGGGGALEPISNISGWALASGFTDPTLPGGSSFVGQGQMLLAGRGITFSRPVHSQFVQIDGPAGAPCWDYVVASDGSGTHTSVRLMMADFLAAAAAGPVSKSCWICSDDTDTNIEFGSADGDVANSTLLIEGAGFWSASNTSAKSPRATLTATIGTTNDAYLKSTLFYTPRIIFKNLRLVTTDTGGSVSHAFISHKPSVGSTTKPRVIAIGCFLRVGHTSATNANGCFYDCVTSSLSGDTNLVILEDCQGTTGQVYRFSAGTGAFDHLYIRRCDLTINNLCTNVQTTTIGLIDIQDSVIVTTGYLINNTTGSQVMFSLHNSRFRHTGSTVWFRFASAQSNQDTVIYVAGVHYTQSNSTIGAMTIAGQPFSEDHRCFIDSSTFASDSVNAATAIVASASNWLTMFAGNVDAPNFAAATSGFTSGSTAHEADTTGAHAASAISNTPAGTIAATNVQTAINELATDYIAADAAHVAAGDPHPLYALDTDLANYLNKNGTTALTGNWVQSGAFNIYTAGALRVGSSTAPTNNTAGDITAGRLIVGDDTALSAATGEFVRFAGSMVDTSTGAKIFFLSSPSISPATDTSAGTDFRTFYMQTLLTDAGGAIPGLVNSVYAENRNRNSKAIGTLYGVKSVAMLFDSSSPATVGTVTSASALYGQVYIRPSGSSAGTLTTGRGLDLTDLVHSNSLTITNLYGIDIANPGGNALSNMYGINIDVLTRGSVLNVGIKNASNMRQTGYMSLLGATTAPLNTGSGDFSASTLTIGTDSTRGALTGYLANLSTTLTDTSAGVKIGLAVGLTINPAGASASEFRSFTMSLVTPAGNAQNFSQIHEGIFAFNELDGSGNSTATAFGGLIGVLGIGYEVASSGADNGGTISRSAGIVGLGFNTATAATGKTLSAGVGVLSPNPSAIGSLTVTEYVGIEIEALTRLSVGTGRIGFRNADTTQFLPTAQQSIAVSAAISASATVVQVSTTTAANMTATPTVANGVDGQVLIIVNTGANTFTLQDQGTLASSNLRLSATGVALATRDSIILMYSTSTGDWIQIGQTNVI